MPESVQWSRSTKNKPLSKASAFGSWCPSPASGHSKPASSEHQVWVLLKTHPLGLPWWLRHLASTAGGMASILSWGIKILHASWPKKKKEWMPSSLCCFPLASQVVQLIKNLPVNAADSRDAGSIPGLQTCPTVGNGI